MKTAKFLDSIKNRLRSYARLVVFVISLALILSLAGNLAAIRKAENRISEAEDRVNKLKQEREELAMRLGDVESDYYVELQLRDSLGLAKENEIIVVLPDDEILRKLAPRVYFNKERLPDPNWKRWLNLFL